MRFEPEIQSAVDRVEQKLVERYPSERLRNFRITNPEYFAKSIEEDVMRAVINEPALTGWMARVKLTLQPNLLQDESTLVIGVTMVPPIERVNVSFSLQE